MDRLFDLASRLALPIVSLVAISAMAFTGNVGVTEVSPGEVAVVYNTATGTSRVVQQQGLLTTIPVLNKVTKLSLEPQVFVMQGSSSGPNLAPVLRVRANDGSLFTFPKMETHYQVIPDLADKVIECFGLDDSYTRDIIPTVTREVFRNEFGRFSFLEIADPSSYGSATSRSREQINAKLLSCGLTVTNIVTPKPVFSRDVEEAIEARQNAEQAVEVQKTKRERLIAQKDRQVQEVRQSGNLEYQSLSAELTAALAQASNDALAVRREADKYALRNVAECEAERDAKVQRAAGNAESYKKAAEGLAAQIKAVGGQGPEVLHMTVASKVMPQLATLKATPYAQASYPLDIRSIPAQSR